MTDCEKCQKILDGQKEIMERLESISLLISLGTTKMVTDFRDAQARANIELSEKLDLNYRILKLLNDYDQEILGTTNEIVQFTQKDLEETSKVLLWLELKAARQADIKTEDIGLFDPLVLELLKKYSGLEWVELARIIKNKGIKNLVNKMKQDEEDR